MRCSISPSLTGNCGIGLPLSYAKARTDGEKFVVKNCSRADSILAAESSRAKKSW